MNSSRISDDDIWMIKNITNTALQFYEDISSALNCYDFSSFFIPFETEEDLVNHAIMKNITFLSSINTKIFFHCLY